MSFSQRPAVVPPDIPPPLVDPVAEANTLVDFIAQTTPGGGIMAQTLLVILVYAAYILKAPPS